MINKHVCVHIVQQCGVCGFEPPTSRKGVNDITAGATLMLLNECVIETMKKIVSNFYSQNNYVPKIPKP